MLNFSWRSWAIEQRQKAEDDAISRQHRRRSVIIESIEHAAEEEDTLDELLGSPKRHRPFGRLLGSPRGTRSRARRRHLAGARALAEIQLRWQPEFSQLPPLTAALEAAPASGVAQLLHSVAAQHQSPSAHPRPDAPWMSLREEALAGSRYRTRRRQSGGGGGGGGGGSSNNGGGTLPSTLPAAVHGALPGGHPLTLPTAEEALQTQPSHAAAASAAAAAAAAAAAQGNVPGPAAVASAAAAFDAAVAAANAAALESEKIYVPDPYVVPLDAEGGLEVGLEEAAGPLPALELSQAVILGLSCGGISGMLSRAVVHPFDTLRVLQSVSSSANAAEVVAESSAEVGIMTRLQTSIPHWMQTASRAVTDGRSALKSGYHNWHLGPKETNPLYDMSQLRQSLKILYRGCTQAPERRSARTRARRSCSPRPASPDGRGRHTPSYPRTRTSLGPPPHAPTRPSTLLLLLFSGTQTLYPSSAPSPCTRPTSVPTRRSSSS